MQGPAFDAQQLNTVLLKIKAKGLCRALGYKCANLTLQNKPPMSPPHLRRAQVPLMGPVFTDSAVRRGSAALGTERGMYETAAWIHAFPGLGTKEGGRGEAHSTLEV